ncbi:MAG: protein-export membrane protein SecF [Candidatus Magasanikbacteria bacterium RIFOXYC12_FULL_33_11]|uniref:Protein-export membrane protein SecF n=1 Tax=Candidatus Magasanikbacteria bacterium RIFOXYC12_FULL_33_11 TaxID=1798701 RepID=A0A1F6NRG3_9BACT|nr:MAG: protein-export membrane protein SecF [Candidatus Magasanikbacteria bacterium RIFOXYC12_FULL_33_11]
MLNIVGKRKIFFAISSLFVLASVIFIVIFGLKPGIDFTGGSLMEISFTSERPTISDVRDVFADNTYGNVLVQPTEETGYLLKMRFISEEEHKVILNILRDKFEVVKDNGLSVVTEGSDSQLINLESTTVESASSSTEAVDGAIVENRLIEDRVETIGPAISSQLQKRSFEAAIAVVLAIVFYVAYAFRKVSKPVQSWKYGITAIIALIHDVTITMGVFAILGKFYNVEVDIPFVVAILTILGYSVNDTIVVFDRVRENLIKYGYEKFDEIVNKGVNETLVRSLNTSFTTLIVLFALFLFGGSTIHYFSLALIIGIFFGTYSSIFLASPLLVVWQKISKN